MIRRFGYSLLGIAILGLALTGCGKEEPQGPPAAPKETIKVEPRTKAKGVGGQATAELSMPDNIPPPPPNKGK